MTTTSTLTRLTRRTPRYNSQGKHQTPQHRPAFDPVAYAAALEVLG